MYSPTGQLNFPVPGVAYNWNPSPQFHALIGLPTMMIWRPNDDWQIQASYMLISTIHIKAQRRLTEHLYAYAAYDWSNEAYALLDSPEVNDRFFIYDQRVSLGLQTSLGGGWTAALASGFVFDRYLFEGTQVFGGMPTVWTWATGRSRRSTSACGFEAAVSFAATLRQFCALATRRRAAARPGRLTAPPACG